jgi:hypothetical protein
VVSGTGLQGAADTANKEKIETNNMPTRSATNIEPKNLAF